MTAAAKALALLALLATVGVWLWHLDAPLCPGDPKRSTPSNAGPMHGAGHG